MQGREQYLIDSNVCGKTNGVSLAGFILDRTNYQNFTTKKITIRYASTRTADNSNVVRLFCPRENRGKIQNGRNPPKKKRLSVRTRDFRSPPVVLITITVIPIAAERSLHDFPGNEVKLCISLVYRSFLSPLIFTALKILNADFLAF